LLSMPVGRKSHGLAGYNTMNEYGMPYLKEKNTAYLLKPRHAYYKLNTGMR